MWDCPYVFLLFSKIFLSIKNMKTNIYTQFSVTIIFSLLVFYHCCSMHRNLVDMIVHRRFNERRWPEENRSVDLPITGEIVMIGRPGKAFQTCLHRWKWAGFQSERWNSIHQWRFRSGWSVVCADRPLVCDVVLGLFTLYCWDAEGGWNQMHCVYHWVQCRRYFAWIIQSDGYYGYHWRGHCIEGNEQLFLGAILCWHRFLTWAWNNNDEIQAFLQHLFQLEMSRQTGPAGQWWVMRLVASMFINEPIDASSGGDWPVHVRFDGTSATVAVETDGY